MRLDRAFVSLIKAHFPVSSVKGLHVPVTNILINLREKFLAVNTLFKVTETPCFEKIDLISGKCLKCARASEQATPELPTAIAAGFVLKIDNISCFQSINQIQKLSKIKIFFHIVIKYFCDKI